MVAAVDEVDTRSHDEVFESSGDKDLSGTRQGSHASRDMDREPSEMIATDFALAGV